MLAAVALAQTSRARKKDAARRLLEAYDLDGVERWASAEPQAALLLFQVAGPVDRVLLSRPALLKDCRFAAQFLEFAFHHPQTLA